MNKWNFCAFVLAAVTFLSCQDGDKMVATTTVDSKFETGIEGWSAGFSEYSTETDTATLQMRFAWAKLRSPLDTTTSGLRMQSNNRIDDMFMFVKKKISGFSAGKQYSVSFDIDFATQYAENSVGAGGSPGGSVYVKAGATAEEPLDTIENDFHTFNLDKGSQSEGGKDMIVLGNASNGQDKNGYAMVKRGNGGEPITATANDKGEIWLCIGTDSGYEGLSIFYYDRIVVKISEKMD